MRDAAEATMLYDGAMLLLLFVEDDDVDVINDLAMNNRGSSQSETARSSREEEKRRRGPTGKTKNTRREKRGAGSRFEPVNAGADSGPGPTPSHNCGVLSELGARIRFQSRRDSPALAAFETYESRRIVLG